MSEIRLEIKDQSSLSADLPPGFWNLQVTSSSATCTVNVRTQSDVQVREAYLENTKSSNIVVNLLQL